MTTRRGFLKLFSGAVAAAALIPLALRKQPVTVLTSTANMGWQKKPTLTLVADVDDHEAVWCERCKQYHPKHTPDFRAQAKENLANWWADEMDKKFIEQAFNEGPLVQRVWL